MMMAASSGIYLVSPGPALLALTGLLLAIVLLGGVTAAKGRWGWLLTGLFTGGLAWIIGAFLPPNPRSLWTRVELRRRGRIDPAS